MRRPRVRAAVGAAALAAAGLAVGTGPVAAPARATPLACTGDCSVVAYEAGYLSPVTEITSGSSLVFTSIDSSHPTGEAFPTTDACFGVPANNVEAPIPVRFDHTGTGVEATVEGTTVPCSSAEALPDGSYAVAFRCRIHPWMFGSAVVTAA